MRNKVILCGTDARLKIKNGIDRVANVVKSTLGPKGKTIILRKEWGPPIVTRDGVTVAREITLKDPLEDVGAQLCKQVASKTNETAGDGTTTATILAQALVEESLKSTAVGANSNMIKKGIDLGVDAVCDFLEKEKRILSYDDYSELEFIGTISGNDKEVGENVAHAFTSVGPDGVVTFEETKLGKTKVEITEGFEYDRGYLSPHFANDPTKNTAEYEDCLVFLWEKSITNHMELVPLMNILAQAQKPVLIVTDDLSGDAFGMVLLNYLKGVVKVVAVKAPGFGERRKNLMSDMALLTGGTFFAEELGKKLEAVSLTELGTAKKVIVSKDRCIILGGQGDKVKIDERIENLKKLNDELTDPSDIEKTTERIAKLSGCAALIKIGAPLESEVMEKKYRYEDAINAVKAALEEGIIPGGGVPLYLASERVLPKLIKTETDADVKRGLEIVQMAIKVPLMTILSNTGLSGDDVFAVTKKILKGGGYDGKTGEFVKDMFSRGITDPVKVTKSALINAGAIVGIFLNTEGIITDEIEEKK